MIRRLSIAFILIIFTLSGCSTASDNHNTKKTPAENVSKTVYSGEITPFTNTNDINIKSSLNNIAISLSPSNKYIYYMQPYKPAKNNIKKSVTLKGRSNDKVSIVKYDIQSGKSKIIIKNIPFVSLVKWNKDGNIAGFCGNNKLTLYDEKNDKLLFKDEFNNDSITYFGWSPNGKTVYTEHSNLANGTIYRLDNNTVTQSYEGADKIYFKGELNNNFYYGTTNDVLGDNAITYLLDKNKNIIKEIASGKFRGSYKNSIVLVGRNSFQLFMISDINNSSNIKLLSNKFIYDVKFIHNGSLMYIDKDNSIEENRFLLHIVDKDGLEISKSVIYGDSIALSYDGKSGYVSGPRKEYVDFINNTTKINNSTNPFNEEAEEIFKTIRGSMDTYGKFEITRQRDYENLDKYFIDTESPYQWAHFDLLSRFKGDENKSEPQEYILNISLEDFTIDLKNLRASFIINLDVSNSFGSGAGMGEALELIKKYNQWFVTGFSTFPYSKEHSKVETIVKKYVEQCKSGRLFNGTLKGRDIAIKQIQFWEMSSPHHSCNVKYSNYCKVYLMVRENNKDVMYKLVLNRKNQSEWKPTRLENSYLWYLL